MPTSSGLPASARTPGAGPHPAVPSVVPFVRPAEDVETWDREHSSRDLFSVNPDPRAGHGVRDAYNTTTAQQLYDRGGSTSRHVLDSTYAELRATYEAVVAHRTEVQARFDRALGLPTTFAITSVADSAQVAVQGLRDVKNHLVAVETQLADLMKAMYATVADLRAGDEAGVRVLQQAAAAAQSAAHVALSGSDRRGGGIL